MYGEGKIVYSNGAVYKGPIAGEDVDPGGRNGGTDGIPSGEGGVLQFGGVTQTGTWDEEGEFVEGTTIYANGDSYTGQYFDDGVRSDEGIMKYANGDIYKGEWEDDKRDGKGVMTYANGDVYEGEWEDDKRHGKGVMTYANGDVYEGEWEDDKIVQTV